MSDRTTYYMKVSEPRYQRATAFSDQDFIFTDLNRALEEAQRWIDKGQCVRVYHYSADGLNCYDDFYPEDDEPENELVRDGGQFGLGA
jgi:23S rRNA G2069 N7-methylase RlmK/C1962 C5-methylase RlmI